MADIGDSCNIVPRTIGNNGQEIDSPLYLDIAEMYKGDRDKAVSLYTKATSDEVLRAISELPTGLAKYYPGTSTPTLATVLNVSNIESTDPTITTDLQNWLQSKIDFNVKSARNLAKVTEFNDGEWNTRFRCYYDNDGNVFIGPHLDAPDPLIGQTKFESIIYRGIQEILKSLNITEDEFDEMASDKDSVLDRMPYFTPENFLDLFLSLSNLAHSKPVILKEGQAFSHPNVVMAKILLKYMKNSPFYHRFINNLKKDDYYKRTAPKGDAERYSDEELLERAAIHIMASVIGKDKVNKINGVDISSTKLLNDFKVRIQGNRYLSEGYVSSVLMEANKTTSSINDGFLSDHPQFTKLELIDSEASVIRDVLNKIAQYNVKYIDIAQHMYAENASNTEDVPMYDVYRDIDTIRRYAYSPHKEDVDRVTRQLIINLHTNTEALAKLLEALSSDNNTSLGILSNNNLCGKLRQASYTIQYVENVLTELERIRYYQDKKHIKSEIFNADINKLIAQVYSIISSSKGKVATIERKAVINELEKIFPNTTWTLPNGDRVGIGEWIESDPAVYDLFGRVERYTVSVSQCSNPLLTLLDSYKKRAVEEGRQEVEDIEHKLIEAAKGMKSKDTRWMFTNKKVKVKDEDGHVMRDENGRPLLKEVDTPSNKYIMDYVFSDFEADYLNYTRELSDNKSIPLETKEEMRLKWWMEHTEERPDLDGGRYPKRDIYSNPEFEKLTDAQKHYWQVFMHEKGRLISYFPNRNYGIDDVIFIRKPNRELIKSQRLKGLWKIMRSRWKQYTSRDIDFGSENVLTDFEHDTIYSLPEFYNHLQEGETLEDINTDTTSSLVAYAEVMMNSASLKNVINILECAGNVIENMHYKDRGIYGTKKTIIHRTGRYKESEEYHKPASEILSYKMFKDWMQMQVYGQRVSKDFRKLRLIAGDIMAYINFGTLALNTFSAVGNIIQGINQMVPAAVGGYFFSLKDLRKANDMYVKYIFNKGGLFEAGSTTHDNKLNLFSRKFDIMQEYDKQDINYDRTRAGRLMDSSILYVMQNMGEHLLQTTGALAVAMNKKNVLMDKDGNFFSAFDAYDTVKLSTGGSRLVLKPGLVATIHDKELTIVTNEELRERAERVGKSFLDRSLLSDNEISEGEWVSTLKQKMSSTNHYLHGIYNKEDKNRMQFYALGRAAMMYRKYLVPSLKRRFASNSYVAGLDTEVEGYYTTFFDFHKRLLKEFFGDSSKDYYSLNTAQKSIADQWLESEGITDFDSKAAEWSSLDKEVRRSILFGTRGAWNTVKSTLNEFQQSNLKIAWAEVIHFFTLVLANVLLDSDDDDDDDLAMASLKYFARRSQTEVGALSPMSVPLWAFNVVDKKTHPELHAIGRQHMLNEFWQLFQQPIAGMNHLEDVPVIFSLLDFRKLSQPPAYDKNRYSNEWERQFDKLMTPWRQISIFWHEDKAIDYIHRKENWYKK